jgi:NADH-quinone oxidoreductase subunit G
MAEIEHADAIVIIGSNLRFELPLLHARVRKAVQAGAKVHVVSPVDFDFTFEIASKQIVSPSRISDAIGKVDLGGAGSAVVLLGAVAELGAHASAIRQAATAFAAGANAALCRIPQGANAVGLANAGVLPSSRDAGAMLRDGRSAYVLYGIEPGLDFADQASALQALGSAQVVAFSHFACASTRAVADVILPIGLLPEIDATLTNLDGQDQSAIAGGKLPGQAQSGWRVLRALGGTLDAAGFEFTDLASLRAGLQARRVEPTTQASTGNDGEGLEVAVSQAIYRTDGVVRRAAALQAHPLTLGARIVLHPRTAQDAGLAADGIAKVRNAIGSASLPVAISDKVAEGCVWIESGYGATAALTTGRVQVESA